MSTNHRETLDQRNEHTSLGGFSTSQKRGVSLPTRDEPPPKRLAISPSNVTGKLQSSIKNLEVIPSPTSGTLLMKEDPLSRPTLLGHALLAPSAETSVKALDGTRWYSYNDIPNETTHGELPQAFIMPRSCVHPSSMAPPCSPSPSTQASTDVISATHWPGSGTLNEKLFSSDWMDMLSLPDSDASTEEQPKIRNSLLAPRPQVAEECTDSANKEKSAPSSPSTLDVVDEDLLGDIEDVDMAGLLDNVLEPPTSVMRDLDTESRDGVLFDRNLQHSPLSKSPTQGLNAQLEPVDLLDEDVDWEAVMSIADSSSTVISRKSNAEQTVSSSILDHRISLPTPFVRPPVPPKVHDRPVITGMSSRMIIRICFRIGELLNLNAQCQRSGQQATFELFARVTYSSREKSSKTQHFQFKDLFTDRHPYPTGTLTGWRPNSAQDCSAQVFLGSTDKTCRTICRMKKQKQGTALGWVLDILSIRETTWDEMLWVRRIMSRDDPESQTTEG